MRESIPAASDSGAMSESRAQVRRVLEDRWVRTLLLIMVALGTVIWLWIPDRHTTSDDTPASRDVMEQPPARAAASTRESHTQPTSHLPTQIQIGEPMDADDPATWISESPPAQPIQVGRPMDADNPATWGLDDTPTQPVRVGPPMDADDPSTWGTSHSLAQPVQVGTPMDADDPATWMPDGAPAQKPIRIGHPLNADDPATWY